MNTIVLRLAGAVLALSASGCAQLGGDAPVRLAGGGGAAAVSAGPTSASTGRVERDIADDFLHAIAQIEGYSPEEATMRFSRRALATDPVVAALERAMRERGYALRIVADDDPGGSIAHDAVGDPATDERVHTVVVGQVKLRRRYRTAADGGGVASGPLFVLGADVGGIQTERPRDVLRPSAPSLAVVNRVVPVRDTYGMLD